MRIIFPEMLLGILCLLLTGCGLPGGKIPADHFYRLPAAQPVTTAHTVAIQPVRAEGLYNERAILFVAQTSPLELQRYDYHFWALTPAQLVQQYLQGCMPVAKDTSQSAVQLAASVIAFERVVDAGKAQALVKLRINQRDYAASVEANTMDMHATVAAFGAAMQQVCEAAARDL